MMPVKGDVSIFELLWTHVKDIFQGIELTLPEILPGKSDRHWALLQQRRICQSYPAVKNQTPVLLSHMTGPYQLARRSSDHCPAIHSLIECTLLRFNEAKAEAKVRTS